VANKEHLALLKQGVEVWNQWRENNPEVRPDLSGADLVNADLSGANLVNADLSGADLVNADLSGADLVNADLSRANLFKADFGEADLSRADLSRADLRRAYLCEIKLRGAKLRGADLSVANLIEADLSRADLSRADVINANLIGANLIGANLIGASLSLAQALDANFEKAVFTGSCLKDWNINSATRLDGVICDYVYLKPFDQERRPHSGNFAPGEFTKLFQKALETVDLIFHNGIDWGAFLTSYQKLQVECGGEELSIQAIENKNDGAFVIRVNVPPDADKVEMEKYLKREYKLELQAKDELLKFRDEKVKFYRRKLKSERKENTKLLKFIETMAEKENSKYYFDKPQIGNFVDTAQSGSRQQAINHQYNYAPEQKQTLAEAAAEIQRLLKQLEEKNPTATEAEQKAYVTASIPLDRRQRVFSALQAGGKEAMKEFLDNACFNVVIAMIEDWQETK
jgi:uncharacterized protein YjbI with pentapeptide repeats